jgi:hypothetical protein
VNAPASPRHLMAQVTGTMLHEGYQYDDGLVLDLYGTADEDDGHRVESIAVHGTTVNIVQLFRGTQLTNMALWLDLKDSQEPVLIEWAERYRHHAASYLG